MTDTKTKGQEVAADIAALLRARNPLLWIVTREEARVERHLVEAAGAASYMVRTWDVDLGPAEMDGKPAENAADRKSPDVMLNAIRERAGDKNTTKERCVWAMRDLPPWFEGPAGAPVIRQVRNLARSLPGAPREKAQAIVILTPSSKVPDELAGHATVIDFPLPDRPEIASILDATINSLPEFETDANGQPDISKPLRSLAAPNGTRDAAIDAAVGLTAGEAQACFARSLVQLRKIDPATVAKEKKRVVAREGVLEWFDPIAGGLAAVGGLENLKAWLLSRSSAYSPKARAYGLPAPKGVLLVGVPGCGKSLTAKAIATAWGVPLLKVDLGALKSKYVGESEANLRKAFDVIAAIGRCVVWFDEIEKALQGATSGSADGGVSSDALGAMLSWMQERQGEAFVVATANDVSGLPPELLRKGRFDEVFFVDLPNGQERFAILQAALAANGRKEHQIDVVTVGNACQDFTGAEMAAIVPDALFTAFADGERQIETRDLVAAAKTVVPLTKTASEKIAALRKWATERARPATKPDDGAQTARAGVELDI